MIGLDFFSDGSATVRASVVVGGSPLRAAVEAKLARVVVDTHLHLPDMFELTFLDEEGQVVADAGLDIGTKVEVQGGAATEERASKLITGEVTSIEAVCARMHIYTVVRGYEKSHRLQRANRTRTYLNMTDAEVATKVAKDAGLEIGKVDSTSATHAHLAQIAQTDWDFLRQRAREIGYETGVSGGKFFFRKPSGSKDDGGLGGMVGGAVDMVSSLAGQGPPTLTFKQNLLEFYPRLSAANLTPKVEVRLWDPGKAEVVTASRDVKTGTAQLKDEDPATLATQFNRDSPIPYIKLPKIPGLPDLGTPSDSSAYVMVDRPAGEGSTASAAAEEMAKGLAEHIASTFAEAEGYVVGDPAVQAGAQVKVDGVPPQFGGTWTVTNARHVFDEEEGGYHTRFYVSGRHERSLLGLASAGTSQGAVARMPGLVCGVVTNNNDDKGRVKVALPWLGPQYESDWARVVQFGAGKSSGAVFLPEVGDEVLVAFEFGDPRRPYVIGGVPNENTSFDLGGKPVKSTGGMSAAVVKRGFVTPVGNRLLFEDELTPPPSNQPTKSVITLGTGDGSLSVVIDQTAGKVTLSCDPKPPASQSPTGSISIVCGTAGTIDIKTGAGGTVNIDGGANLNLKAQAAVKIESTGIVEIKGNPIKLN
ncbi:hypothetical protein F0L68_23515 [Solihabitans fulvus]|uniref:Gp5/Type VI secretion system Vgr protein OB-fold domain-containing protein n=1 Tax=Solihabitans fulvus TaxID=1892852 RepID=A0A5B2X6F5_9PSEU|nr:phage baseplate assembly protein V [Solihabitans fulvus]KAA2258796.1 hypothetical protein F0L68_23515 [Solihabitans fulvus]